MGYSTIIPNMTTYGGQFKTILRFADKFQVLNLKHLVNLNQNGMLRCGQIPRCSNVPADRFPCSKQGDYAKRLRNREYENVVGPKSSLESNSF
jgi:hypothetical protein